LLATKLPATAAARGLVSNFKNSNVFCANSVDEIINVIKTTEIFFIFPANFDAILQINANKGKPNFNHLLFWNNLISISVRITTLTNLIEQNFQPKFDSKKRSN
jgi:hypothetical protein